MSDRSNEHESVSNSTERADDFEFRIVKHLTNDYHSPVLDYIQQNFNGSVLVQSTEDAYTSNISNAARQFLFVDDHERLNVIPHFCFGQYNVTLTFPDTPTWDTRDINLVPRMGSTVEVAGDISVSSHGFAMFRSLDRESPPYNKLSSPPAFIDDEHLSDKPYLSHIAVVVRPEYFDGKYDSHRNIDHKKIYNELNAKINKLVETEIYAEQVSFELFYSLHTADFIIVLRAVDPTYTYKLSMQLSDEDNFYITHTIQSLEMGLTPTVTAPRYRRPRVDIENTRYLLTFSATVDFHKHIVESCYVANDVFSTSLGEGATLGFNDICINLSPIQFACLYPALCEDRLFKDKSNIDWTDCVQQFKCSPDGTECEQNCSKCVVNFVGSEILMKNNKRISSLSINILHDLKFVISSFEKEEDFQINPALTSATIEHSNRVKNVRDDILALVQRVISLRDKQLVMPYKRSLYISSINLLLDFVRVYMPMAEQDDLFLTGQLVREYIESFILGIEKAVEQISLHISAGTAIKLTPNWVCDAAQDLKQAEVIFEISSEESTVRARELTDRVIRILRSGVDALNVFSRLTMGVNLQFINAANYELFTQTSANKILSAYYEFSNELAWEYSNESPGDNGLANRLIRVLPIPHFNSLQPEAQLLYPHGFVDLNPAKLINDAQRPIHPAIVLLPNIDTFLRVYEIVPYLRHEYNHFLHLREDEEGTNEKRNSHLINITAMEIARKIVFELVNASSAEYAIITNNVQILNFLETRVVQAIIKPLKENAELSKLLPNMLFGELRAVLHNYFEQLLLKNTHISSEVLSRKNGIDMLYEVIDRYIDPNDENIDRDYIEASKVLAYGVELSDFNTVTSNGKTEIRAEIFMPFAQNRIHNKIDEQLTKTISDLKAKKHEAEHNQATLIRLDNLIEQAKTRKGFFEAEWKYAVARFIDALKNPVLFQKQEIIRIGEKSINIDGIANDIKVAIETALDESINEINEADSIEPLRVRQEYEAVRVWVKRKGLQAPYFWKLPESYIKDAVFDCFTIYNEARSDIFMCKTLCFNIPGYIYFLVRSLSRTDNAPLDSLFYHRALLTMHSLSAAATENEPKATELDIDAEVSTSNLYSTFLEEYKTLLNARLSYLLSKIDFLCTNILSEAPIGLLEDLDLFSKACDDGFANRETACNPIEEKDGNKSRQSMLLGVIRNSLKTDLTQAVYTARVELFTELCQPNISIQTRARMATTSTTQRIPIKLLYEGFPLLSQISDALQYIRSIDSSADTGNISDEEYRRSKRLATRFDSIIALCADQLSDILEVERLLYEIRNLPNCRKCEVSHVTAIGNVYEKKHKEVDDMHKQHGNSEINHIIQRIGNYYNGTGLCNNEDVYSTRLMTIDGVKFINEFYWKSRGRIASMWEKKQQEPFSFMQKDGD